MRPNAATGEKSVSARELHDMGGGRSERDSELLRELLRTDIQLYCQNLSLFGKLFIDHKVS